MWLLHRDWYIEVNSVWVLADLPTSRHDGACFGVADGMASVRVDFLDTLEQ